MSDLMPIPVPGADIVPDGWWRSTVVPWADEQDSVDAVRTAVARVAGLEAAYKTLNADTAELMKARRYLEFRWGELLGPGLRGTPGRSNPSASGLERGSRDRFRELAWSTVDNEPQSTKDIVVSVLEGRRDGDTLSRVKVLRAIREALADERRGEPVDDLVTAEVEIRHGDFRGVLRDLYGTVDAIITDPPYEAAFVPMFDDLGELAANLLTPDGVLVVMTGHLHIPEYLDHLATWLRYLWMGCYLTPGPRTRSHVASVATGWKPLLVFHREGATYRPLLDDVFRSNADDKEHHHWGQSESGMAAVVDRFTQRGELVVDPCVGGGTTAVVCRDLGRRFVGCDVDAAAIHAAKERL